MHPLRHRHATRRLIGVALLALLLVQWMALAHAIDHARTPAMAAVSAVESDHDWGHHAGTPTCNLVDLLLAGQALWGHVATVSCLPPAAQQVAALTRSTALSPVSRAYQARGPPRA